MLYNTQNLPRMLSKVLQAQLRNVAGRLDVDQIIESTAGLNPVGAEMKRIATRWGVHVDFVKIQKVEAGACMTAAYKVAAHAEPSVAQCWTAFMCL